MDPIDSMEGNNIPNLMNKHIYFYIYPQKNMLKFRKILGNPDIRPEVLIKELTVSFDYHEVVCF